MHPGDIYQHKEIAWLYLQVISIGEHFTNFRVVNRDRNPHCDWSDGLEVSFDAEYMSINYSIFRRALPELPDWEV